MNSCLQCTEWRDLRKKLGAQDSSLLYDEYFAIIRPACAHEAVGAISSSSPLTIILIVCPALTSPLTILSASALII